FHYSGDDDFSVFDPDDLHALGDAFGYYRANHEKIRGRSTITQQLAKNLYFSDDRSALRKLEEFIVARRLEWFLSKDRILELYLNVAEWGPGLFGAEAAAQRYFDRPAAELTRAQAAALAATLPHPLTSNPDHRPGRMAWRQDLILRRMGGTGPVRTVPLAPEPVEIEAPTIDVDLGPPADTAASADSVPPDTIPSDTQAPATLPPDTTGRDTIPVYTAHVTG
ncbi:MAG: transglycosylase domain-containing protein, partial [Longimicrobiales bacterium]